MAQPLYYPHAPGAAPTRPPDEEDYWDSRSADREAAPLSVLLMQPRAHHGQHVAGIDGFRQVVP
ncbi:MAG: hypothetical protein ACREVJ_01855, partial [Gammaproteobacteria bacterium]